MSGPRAKPEYASRIAAKQVVKAMVQTAVAKLAGTPGEGEAGVLIPVAAIFGGVDGAFIVCVMGTHTHTHTHTRARSV